MNLLRLLVAAAVLSMPVQAISCDICGCAGGGNSLGLLPLVQRHYVGFRWQAQGYQTDAHGSEPNSVEHFRTLDFWGRWQPHARLQVVANVPYQFNNRRYEDGRTLNIQDLGDIYTQVFFSVFNPRIQSARRWQHTLLVGAGLKLPTGKNNYADPASETGELAAAMQPGTGGTDYLISGLYALRLGRWGISMDASMKCMGKSKTEYQFGNRINGGFRAFTSKTIEKTTCMPYVGVLLDHRNEDYQNDKRQSETGGWASFGLVGMEVFRNDIALSAGWQIPVDHYLSQGRVVPKTRFNASAVWLFGGKKRVTPMAVPQVFPNVK